MRDHHSTEKSIHRNHHITEEDVNDMIMKYTDEAFTIRDAVRFQLLLKDYPEYFQVARVNRAIRRSLRSLPGKGAAPGFEQRLEERLRQESEGSARD